MNNFKKIIENPFHIITPLAMKGFFNWLPDKPYLKLVYRAQFAKKLDLNNPKTYNEKLQWIKLYDRKPQYTKMVDKYEVKQYVSRLIGKDYIIPTLGVYNSFSEIDFNKLPEKFVLKCTHDSGGLVICKNKNELNMAEAQKKINKSLCTNYYRRGREWPYKNVKPRIIAEQFIEDYNCDEGLVDYKFYCFSGKVRAVMINSGRGSGHTKADYFDANFNHLDFCWGYPNSVEKINKPDNFQKMIFIAEQLSKGISELRVDLYNTKNGIFFGELTFFDGSGFEKFSPDIWDYQFGEWLELPTEMSN